MGWSNGVFTRDYPSWANDAASSLPISASKFDTEDNGFAAGLNNCITVDGLNKPTSTLNWAVQMNWTRGSDGNIWSLARTGGANNPKIQGSVTDATGISFAVTGGNLAFTGANGFNATATAGGMNLTATAGGLTATATAGALALVASAAAVNVTASGGNNITLNGAAITGQGPVAAAMVDMTPDKSSFSTTLSGPYTSNPTGTLKWVRQGGQVTIYCDTSITGTGTTSGNAITGTGIPAAIQPAATRQVLCANIEDNGIIIVGWATILTNGNFNVQPLKTISGANPQSIGLGTFAGSGVTGIVANWAISYPL